jgi:hypothetical protein
MKHFYHHIIEIETIYTVLDVMDLADHEKKELIILIDSTLHHTIIDTVLSELSEKDKKIFLKNLEENNHDTIWQHLQSSVEHIDQKINRSVNLLMEELHADVQEAKNRSIK